MRENWKYERLLDACDVYQPATISTKQLVEDGEFDVFGANGKIGKYSSYNHEESEVLLTCRGATCGNINVSTPKSWINGNAMVVHPKEKNLLKNYLVYLLKTINYAEVITGSAQPQITRQSLKSVHIPVPPLSEQERIVSYLDAEYAKIDALKANIEQQLQASKDLFQLQFRQIIDNIGECAFDTLGDICTTINGLWKGKKPPFVNVGVIRNANFTKEFTLNFSNIEYLDVEEKQYRTRKLEKGDLIVEKSGGSEKQPVGRTVLFDSEGEFSVSNFTSILRIKDRGLYLPKYIYLYLLYVYKDGVTKEMQNATTGIHNIIFDKFLAIKIPALSIVMQEEIISQSEILMDKIGSLQTNYNKTLTLCNDLKQSLLKSIFE